MIAQPLFWPFMKATTSAGQEGIDFDSCSPVVHRSTRANPVDVEQRVVGWCSCKRDLALYRLAFGQPRQEDMELLGPNGVSEG